MQDATLPLGPDVRGVGLGLGRGIPLLAALAGRRHDGTVEQTDGGHARLHEADGLLTVTIDRPRKRNAISPEVTAVLWKAVDLLTDRDDLGCLVITAAGPLFSAGIDLNHGAGNRRGMPPSPQPWNGWHYRRNYRGHHLLYDELEAVEKPVVLAAQGPVFGAGVEMALSCDFRFCTENATWRLPEVTLGAIAGSGGTTRLTRLVGPHWAKWMAMAAKPVEAGEAVRIGLVHQVLPADTFLNEVYAFCRELLAIPSEAVGLAKLVVDAAADVTDRNAQRNIDRIANTTLRVRNSVFEERTRSFRTGD